MSVTNIPSFLQNLVNRRDYKSVPCALVLEDSPVSDNRLQFDSFPDQLEEAYAVNAYREIAAKRMPQPGYVSYRGGNWSSFALELKFRAEKLPPGKSLNSLTTNDMQDILLSMERKVRWCQALAFPVERTAGEALSRVTRSVSLIGKDSQSLALKSALRGVSDSQAKIRDDPPIVLVVFGTFLILRTYITNYSLRWEAPFHPVTAQPYGCVVTLTFQRLERGYPTFQDIRNSAGLAQQSPDANRIRGTIPLRVETLEQLTTQRVAANARVAQDNRNSPTSLSLAGNG